MGRMASAVEARRGKGVRSTTQRNQKALHRRTSSRTTARPRPSRAPHGTPAQRAKAQAAAHEAARLAGWASPGVAVAANDGVTVWGHACAHVRPYWHLVTQGLWPRGFEVSLKVVRARDEVAPPGWAVALVERQAKQLGEAAGAPDASGCVVGTAPLVPEGESALSALAFSGDAAFAGLAVPVWQLVPLTADEERLVREWSPAGLLDVLRAVDPLLLADPERGSLLQSPRARLAIEQRVAREGSSLSAMRARVSQVVRGKGGQATWRLSKDAVDTVAALLKGRTAHQRPFTVHGASTPLEVRPGDAAALELEPGGPVLKLSQAASRQLRAQLKARPGRYGIEAFPGFTVEVV